MDIKGGVMGWADDMHEGGYTENHGGLMDDVPSSSSRSKRYKSPKVQNKSGPGSRWSEDDRNQMIGMYEADVNITIIAKKLNRSPFAIACQLYDKNEIPDSIRKQFQEDSTFDASISTIDLEIKNLEKIKSAKVRKLKDKEYKLRLKEDKLKMIETVKSIIVLVIFVIIVVSLQNLF